MFARRDQAWLLGANTAYPLLGFGSNPAVSNALTKVVKVLRLGTVAVYCERDGTHSAACVSSVRRPSGSRRPPRSAGTLRSFGPCQAPSPTARPLSHKVREISHDYTSQNVDTVVPALREHDRVGSLLAGHFGTCDAWALLQGAASRINTPATLAKYTCSCFTKVAAANHRSPMLGRASPRSCAASHCTSQSKQPQSASPWRGERESHERSAMTRLISLSVF